MATIKSYTDIEQSRKLAEILPLESADMTWEQVTKNLTEDFKWKPTIGLDVAIKDNLFSYRNGYVLPCWGLAALLSVIPEGVIENYYAPNLQKEDGKYSIAYGDDELLCIADNPIDACYEMILKLHELKFL